MKGKVSSRLGVLIAVCAVWFSAFVAQGSESYVFVAKWGTQGSGDGEFSLPTDVAVDSSGNAYVADFNNHRIQKFTSDGEFLTKSGSYGTGDGEFGPTAGLALDSSGNVYVADTGNHRIQKFRPSFPVERVGYGPGGLTVVWVSAPGNRYRIWQSPDLARWWGLQTIMQSEGDSTSWTDDTAGQVPQRFYKIELLP